jgi:hypothetical protein
VDRAGAAFVAGLTQSTNFPTASPVQAAIASVQNAFVTKLDASGSSLVYSTYLGGNGNDDALAVAVNGAGETIVAGSTSSTTFPTASPFQAANAGGTDGFVSRLSAPTVPAPAMGPYSLLLLATSVLAAGVALSRRRAKAST